jgi:predicted urease superfamily metal-dependent hydrolase
LVDRGEYEQIGATMRRFVSQAATVRQNLPKTGQEVDDPLGVHIEVLSGLVELDKVPEEAKEAIQHAIDCIQKIPAARRKR